MIWSARCIIYMSFSLIGRGLEEEDQENLVDTDLCLVLISSAFKHTNAISKHTIKEQRITIFDGLNLKCPLSHLPAKVAGKKKYFLWNKASVVSISAVIDPDINEGISTTGFSILACKSQHGPFLDALSTLSHHFHQPSWPAALEGIWSHLLFFTIFQYILHLFLKSICNANQRFLAPKTAKITGEWWKYNQCNG